MTKNLVGIDSDVREMMRKLGVDNQDVGVVEGAKKTERCVVAVCGLPGVGKTTLAKVVYNKISHLFDACSFLKDVRDEIEQKKTSKRRLSKVQNTPLTQQFSWGRMSNA